MRRSVAVLALLAALGVALPVRAHSPTYGSVLVATASPSPGRLHYVTTGGNGYMAYVFPLPVSADNKTYTLSRTAGATGAENLDVLFYESIDGFGQPCATKVTSDTPTTETGKICPLASEQVAWAVVYLRVGAKAKFTFSY